MKTVNSLFTPLRLTPFPALAAVAVHVAPNENDAGSGDPSQPFATIERARLAVRERAPALSEAIHIPVHAGDYVTIAAQSESVGTQRDDMSAL